MPPLWATPSQDRRRWPRDHVLPRVSAMTGQVDPSGDYSVRDLLADPKVVVDMVLPTLIFVGVTAGVSIMAGAGAAVLWCGLVIAYRLRRRQRLTHAVSGLGAVVVGVVVALLTDGAEGFFLPGIIGNIAFGAVCLISVVGRRPAVAYTSAALYRWPLKWYFHPRVRPAYSETTIVWGVYYLAKGFWQYRLVQQEDLAALTTVRLVLGWPGLAGLLAATYAFITWRLRTLDAPDVDEFREVIADAD